MKRCVICKKIEGKAFQSPREPSLPSCRVSDEPPFTNIGIDYAGPLFVNENDETVKSYGLFVHVCVYKGRTFRTIERFVHEHVFDGLSAFRQQKRDAKKNTN